MKYCLMVRMQGESSLRQEQACLATEDQIQAQQRQTEKERAQIEQQTIRVRAMAEAEGRAHEAKLTEDQNRKRLVERMREENESGLQRLIQLLVMLKVVLENLTDRTKLIMTVGGVMAIAAGVNTTREGARVSWGYINRIARY